MVHELMGVPSFVLAAALLAVVLGIPFGLYALLTRGQRRTTREIRVAAAEHGWKYWVRHWQGDPTAFRIDGRTPNGLDWILTSEGTSGYDRGWTVRLGLRVPALSGEPDVFIWPRDSKGDGPKFLGPSIPAGAESRIASISELAAREAGFLRDARELSSGVSAFDAVYQILAVPERMRRSPVDAALAERILHWPPEAIVPHSVLSWRDPYAFQIHARLPAPPNWATVSHFLSIAEDLIARLPPPLPSPAPHGWIDRIAGRLLGS